MNRAPRLLSALGLLLVVSVVAAGRPAQAGNCGFDNSGNPIPCPPACESTYTCTSREWTSAPFLGRDAYNRCLYQCNFTDTYTGSCFGDQFTWNGSYTVAAGPWANNFCEPAVDPVFFCSFFFGTSC
jgi:hypothetical protein